MAGEVFAELSLGLVDQWAGAVVDPGWAEVNAAQAFFTGFEGETSEEIREVTGFGYEHGP